MEFCTETSNAREAYVHQIYYEYCAQLQLEYKRQTNKMTEFKTKAHYWEAQFRKVKMREEELSAEIEELKAKLRKREQQLFGRSSEKSNKAPDTNPLQNKEKTKKKRGQQPGSKGHSRRDYSDLPVVIEELEFTEESCKCLYCHSVYEELPLWAESDILEIDVKAHRRILRRKKYKRTCTCKQNPDPQIVSPPVIERLLPKSKLGISIWALLLLKKYEYQQPMNRVLEELAEHGLSLSAGTVTDGFQKLLPYFIPLYDAIVERSLEAQHWHADETGWKVFEKIEGKNNHNWYLWIFHNTETVVFKIHPTRSSEALIEHFGEAHTGGTLNVDRYGAYKVIAKKGLFILAFCWAHVRRDFLNHAKGYSEQEAWALDWVDQIANLYHINNQRIQYKPKTKLFHEKDRDLKKAISDMRKKWICSLQTNQFFPQQINY